jgi:phosphatidylinositol kinase/protein kinase (PI-3  family)
MQLFAVLNSSADVTLKIRNFAVIPLGPHSGLIQW